MIWRRTMVALTNEAAIDKVRNRDLVLRPSRILFCVVWSLYWFSLAARRGDDAIGRMQS